MNKFLKIITLLLTISAFSQVFQSRQSTSIKDLDQLSEFYLKLSNTFLELSRKAKKINKKDISHYEKELLFNNEMNSKLDVINNTVLEIDTNFKGSPGI